MGTFITFLILGIVLVAFASYLFGKDKEGLGGIVLIFSTIFLGGAFGSLKDYVDDCKSEIKYNSTKHNVVQTDTTFISNNGKVDTLITYKLTDKDFKKCKN